jgi:hypothetical protein
MREDDGSLTLACMGCVYEFCGLSQEERAKRYGLVPPRPPTSCSTEHYYQCMALAGNIGCSPTEHYYRCLAHAGNVGCSPCALARLRVYPLSTPFAHIAALLRMADEAAAAGSLPPAVLAKVTLIGYRPVPRSQFARMEPCMIHAMRCWGCRRVISSATPGAGAWLACLVCKAPVYCGSSCLVSHIAVHQPLCEFLLASGPGAIWHAKQGRDGVPAGVLMTARQAIGGSAPASQYPPCTLGLSDALSTRPVLSGSLPGPCDEPGDDTHDMRGVAAVYLERVRCAGLSNAGASACGNQQQMCSATGT